MRFWMGVTDNGWFSTLQSRAFDEINFWQPSPRPFLADAQPGMPFLFKLKRPHNHVAGGGFFVMQTTLPLETPLAPEVADSAEGYGAERTVLPRLGQQGFRIKVTEAYRRRCAVTKESTLIALEAAHIVPYAKEQQHEVSNGLLLRADFHRLFDAGLVGIDADYRIRISGRIRDLYYNGKSYYRLDGKTLENLPSATSDKPDRDRLNWHMQHCFQP